VKSFKIASPIHLDEDAHPEFYTGVAEGGGGGGDGGGGSLP